MFTNSLNYVSTVSMHSGTMWQGLGIMSCSTIHTGIGQVHCACRLLGYWFGILLVVSGLVIIAKDCPRTLFQFISANTFWPWSCHLNHPNVIEFDLHSFFLPRMPATSSPSAVLDVGGKWLLFSGPFAMSQCLSDLWMIEAQHLQGPRQCATATTGATLSHC